MCMLLMLPPACLLTLQAWLLPDGTVLMGYESGMPAAAQSLPATAAVIPNWQDREVSGTTW